MKIFIKKILIPRCELDERELDRVISSMICIPVAMEKKLFSNYPEMLKNGLESQTYLLSVLN